MKTTSAQETKVIAQQFAQRLKGGEFVALIGDLGAGKTTFIQGLAEAMGVTARVKSPTFTVMHEYPAQYGAVKRLVHLDLYRFSDVSEIRALALQDERRPDTVVVMEWPNVLPEVDWKPDFTVTIAPGESADEREITIADE